MKFFISSTFSDLIEERKVAYETIGKMGFQFLGHEIYLRLAVQSISHFPWFPLWGQAPPF